MTIELKFYEFFAGGGMARLGLGSDWTCVFANDNAHQKIAAYNARWGTGELDARGVEEIDVADLPRGAQLAWASFPCQDLSVAGVGKGVGSAEDRATRSGALWSFLDLIVGLKRESAHPAVIALENVTGLLTSNSGRDFAVICEALAKLGYVFGAVIVDAKHFVPQSRPRIFLIAAREDCPIPESVVCSTSERPWHSAGVVNAQANLSDELAARWRWWRLGAPPHLEEDALLRAVNLDDDAEWHAPVETKRLLAMMPATHCARLAEAKRAAKPMIGSLYLRMRPAKDGNVQCAEIAFSTTLGCLRTPRGGASRPRIIVVEGHRVRTRLLSPREAAGLMGLPDDHPLPDSYQHAFQLIGDGVVIPVVNFLARTLLKPLALASMNVSRVHPTPNADLIDQEQPA
ncbi:DNA cytosine methyltransferase [Nitrosovibrio sp. Nv17]|uniref:DNA cytosine methyltransferase n=1 Tax=Nitrosovibrio sp. Nv17 TaxID=1855339 RepID=UPI000908A464|nr:DNA cytosine methyltransferase [Nitrosovibrio sp. Nv17]SFW32046.1 DNA (cytosine-5)-methyltransferase 1 [Nitrosovibrio sp. Nv17]